MRNSSPKQVEASRKNGSQSKGPRTADGKRRIRHNALKYGVYSRDLVLASRGEKLEDYQRLRDNASAHFQTASPLAQNLVDDYASNQFRALRARRAETRHLESEFRSQLIRKKLKEDDQVALLKLRFLNICERLNRAPSRALQWHKEALQEIEVIRQELSSSSAGLRFLLDQIIEVEDHLRDGLKDARARLTIEDALLFMLASGASDENARKAYEYACTDPRNRRSELIEAMMNRARQSTANAGSAPSAPAPTWETTRSTSATSEESTNSLFLKALKDVADAERYDEYVDYCADIYERAIAEVKSRLTSRMRCVQRAESAEAAKASLQEPSPVLDHIERAETTHSRRAYRALDMLFTLNSQLPRNQRP